MTTTILILSGGGPAPTTPLPRADFVIAADSGFALASGLDVTVDLVIGDLDSISSEDLARTGVDGIPVEAHPTDKDATDLELAFQSAVDHGADRIVVAGGGAGRIDHLLGVAGLLTHDRWHAVAVEWHSGDSVTHVVRGHRTVASEPGELISIIPATHAVVSISGTRWKLDHEPLHRGTTHGISNESTSGSVAIDVHSGVVLAVFTRRSA